MSKKKAPCLAENLPLESQETGVLIKWNRETAEYKVIFEGPPLHMQSFKALMQSVVTCMAAFVNDEGVIVPSLPKDEQEATEDQMPINKPDCPIKKKPEDSSDEDNTPPWLKNN